MSDKTEVTEEMAQAGADAMGMYQDGDHKSRAARVYEAMHAKSLATASAAGEPVAPADLVERTAQLIAHRACCGSEHDAANGKLHGYCVVCGVPWPCEYAGKPPARPPAPPQNVTVVDTGQGATGMGEIVPITDEYIEGVIACLGDDAAELRHSHEEVAYNCDKAADLIASLRARRETVSEEEERKIIRRILDAQQDSPKTLHNISVWMHDAIRAARAKGEGDGRHR